MHKGFTSIYIMLTLLLGLMWACNPKEEIVPENPCGNYKQPTADFIMEQTTGRRNANNTDYIWYYNPFNLKDTIVLEGVFQFRSEFTDTNVYKHTWYVGSEKFTNFKVWRDFINVVAPNTYITIHHAVKWQPNKVCNPADDGYDSTSFTFQIVNRFKALYTIGKYRMVYDTVGAPNNQDSIEMEIYFSDNNKPDSVITDPTTKMTDINLRVKGLFTEYPKGSLSEGIVPSNKDPLNGDKIINNTFMIVGTSSNTFLNGFYLYIDSKSKTTLKYNNFYKKYSLKGRKLD